MSDQPIRTALMMTLSGLAKMIHALPQIEKNVPERFSNASLRFMVETAFANADVWPVDKTSRWIGFIQAALYARGVLDIDTERARTRPWFHMAYSKMGLVIPTTVNGP